MKIDKLNRIPSTMTKAFLFFTVIAPVIYCLLSLIALGKKSVVSFIQVMLTIGPLVVLTAFLFFYKYHKQLKDHILSGTKEEGAGEYSKLEAILEKYPSKISAIIFIANLAGNILITGMEYYNGVLVSAQQVFFIFTIGILVNISFTMLFYYTCMTKLYPLTYVIKFKALPVFHKLSIPLLASIIMVFNLAAAGFYSERYDVFIENYKNRVDLKVRMNCKDIDSFFTKMQNKVNSYSQTPIIKKMDLKKVEQFLSEITNDKKNTFVDFYSAARTDGYAVTGNGFRGNLSSRNYFQTVLKTKKAVLTNPLLNKFTGTRIMIYACPIINNGKLVGVFGASIKVQMIEEKLKAQRTSKAVNMGVISRDGKFLFHTSKELISKKLGKDINDDGKKFINTGRILAEKNNRLFEFIFNGSAKLAYKLPLQSHNSILVYTIDKTEFIQKLNHVIMKLTILLLTVITLLSFAVYKITNSFSKPIHNTIKLVKKLTEGDLTATSDDYQPDQFGELIRNQKRFQKKIRDIIESALISSEQLAMSSEQLASTSSSLSDGAQNQAAAIEEASASMEEVSASVELITENAKKQLNFTRQTHNSMEELKDGNQVVTTYADEAQKTAEKSSIEASNGNLLMQNTIKSMNNIYSSTKEIADIVKIITDISDQVNLLSLNAAIEAARAGEHGRGFAVVADEISKLADETSSSAKKISGLVNTGLIEVDKGRNDINATSDSLLHIVEYIKDTEEHVKKITGSTKKQSVSSQEVEGNTRKVMEMADNISGSTDEQVITNQEITKTFEQINQNTQAVAAGAEEIASSAEEISAQADTLKEKISFFKV